MHNEKTQSSSSFPCTYAAKSFSATVRKNSSSGGIFYELASYVITQCDGVVYGCAFDDDLRAKHIRCSSIEEAAKCMGSKYSQSDMQVALLQIQTDLRNGLTVLFTGTPCQVAAVRQIDAVEKNGTLITVDIICHGVLSPEVFQEWLAIIESVRKKPIYAYEHRSKIMGWSHRERIIYKDGSIEQNTRWSEAWRRYFYDNRSLRPSCYCCPYATTARSSDITIGDFWGIEHTGLKYFKDDLGVSLVLVNSEPGLNLFSKLNVEKNEASLQDAIPGNPMLLAPSSYKGDRNKVWEEFHRQGLLNMMKKEKFLVSVPHRVASLIKHSLLRILQK